MTKIFNPPPNWPKPPSKDWTPPPGWQPDPAWGQPPPGWQLWIEDIGLRRKTNLRTLKIFGAIAAVIVLFAVIGSLGDSGEDSTTTAEPASESSSPAPEPTPESTSAKPTKALTPKQQLTKAIREKLGKSNRGISPKATVTAPGKDDTAITVRWASDENLTEGLTRNTLRFDAVDILRIVRSEATWDYSQVHLVATYSLVDKLGNAEEEEVVRATYSREIIDTINFENFSFENVFEVADDAWVHPAFQE